VEATTCHEKSKEDVLECLRNVPLADILKVADGLKPRYACLQSALLLYANNDTLLKDCQRWHLRHDFRTQIR